MKFKLYTEVVLLKDIPEKNLKTGDIATVVEHHPSHSNNDGYTLEVFNALGESIEIATVSESEIAPLERNEILSVRSITTPIK